MWTDVGEFNFLGVFLRVLFNYQLVCFSFVFECAASCGISGLSATERGHFWSLNLVIELSNSNNVYVLVCLIYWWEEADFCVVKLSQSKRTKKTCWGTAGHFISCPCLQRNHVPARMGGPFSAMWKMLTLTKILGHPTFFVGGWLTFLVYKEMTLILILILFVFFILTIILL